MKNNTLYSLLLLLSLISFSGCTKYLDTAPTTAIPETEIYKNTKNIETVINGTWRYLNDTYFTFANPGYSTVMRTSDAMGNDVAVTTKYGYRDPYAFTDLYNASGSRTKAIWTILYKVIDNCNNVIAKVDAAAGEPAHKDLLKGQAKALRAFAYLNLATYYQFSYLKDPNALAVPIYTEPTTTETKGQPKASLKAIYALIAQDLTDAQGLLVNYQRPSSEKYQINLAVVNGLLARTYLNMGAWSAAAIAANDARKGYQLMNEVDYKTGFNDNGNVEWIWGHQQTTEQKTASYTFHYLDVSSAGSIYFSFMADPYFKALFDDTDIRSSLFKWDGLPSREGFLRYEKFKFKSNLIGDIVYMRAAEMLLIEAEGNARAGEQEKAIALLNELKTARNAKPYALGSTLSLVDAILIERRKELWGEGFSLSDILRTQQSVVRKAYVDKEGNPIPVSIITPDGITKSVDAQGHRVIKFPNGTDFSVNSNYYLFAIPRDEVNNNSDL